MPEKDVAAVILRTTDLLWCLAIADVEDGFVDRRTLLDELRNLEQRSRWLGQADLYFAIVKAM